MLRVKDDEYRGRTRCEQGLVGIRCPNPLTGVPQQPLIHSTANCFSNQRKFMPINAPVNATVHDGRTQAAYTERCNRF